jgi:uncharacterized membrane protein
VAKRQRPSRSNPPVPHQQHDQDGGNQTIVSTSWVGPLPPRAVLREFDELVPNGAERIFSQFEAEAAHRRDCEDKQVRFSIRDAHIGQFLAGLYAVLAFSVAAYAIHRDAYWVASIIGGTTIVGGIIAFLRLRDRE